jgi:hypothetical protein
MRARSDTIIVISGAVVVAVIIGVFGATHYRALLNQAAPETQASEPQAALNIPTVEAMCAAAGPAGSDSFKQCQTDESAAGEFVIAWMGLNGFLANGAIDLEQIQLQASLGGNDPFGLSSSTAGDLNFGGDPSLDPGLGGDPSLGGFPGSVDGQLGGVVDPVTGAETPVFSSPAELALFCLSESTDWMKMHDCIAENDPSSQFSGGP